MSPTLATAIAAVLSALIAVVGMLVTLAQTRAAQRKQWADIRDDDERQRRRCQDLDWDSAALDIGPEHAAWLAEQRALCEEGRRPLPPVKTLSNGAPAYNPDRSLLVTVWR